MTTPHQQVDAALRACETREKLEQLVLYAKKRANDILIERNAIAPSDMDKNKIYTIEIAIRGRKYTFNRVRYVQDDECFRNDVEEDDDTTITCTGDGVVFDGLLPPPRKRRALDGPLPRVYTSIRTSAAITDYCIYDPTILIR